MVTTQAFTVPESFWRRIATFSNLEMQLFPILFCNFRYFYFTTNTYNYDFINNYLEKELESYGKVFYDEDAGVAEGNFELEKNKFD